MRIFLPAYWLPGLLVLLAALLYRLGIILCRWSGATLWRPLLPPFDDRGLHYHYSFYYRREENDSIPRTVALHCLLSVYSVLKEENSDVVCDIPALPQPPPPDDRGDMPALWDRPNLCEGKFPACHVFFCGGKGKREE